MRAKEFIYEAVQQGNRWTGDEYYRHLVERGYNPAELSEEELEEGWKQWAAGGALALGALGAHNAMQNKAVDQQPQAQPTITQPAQQAQQAPDSALDSTEKYLASVAGQAGIKGEELAQFLAQLKHESWDFTKMDEKGGNNYFKQKYDPQFAPKTAKILGNTKPGDGAKYHGRGYIQLTGHGNYAAASKALGVDLVNHPELAADPATAAKIAVWFWQNKTKNITDFSDTKTVTHKINPALAGLDSRQQNFAAYSKLFKIA
jgi:predicted chitinase